MARKMIILFFFLALPCFLRAGDFVVRSVKGNAVVRHGVSEQWVQLRGGEKLTSDDVVRTGQRSSVTLSLPSGSSLRIPEYAVLNLSDVRALSQEELLLKLAMENIRNVPRNRREGIIIPNTTVVHGSDKAQEAAASNASEKGDGLDNSRLAEMEFTGAQVLFNHDYYGTCILRTKEVLRLSPEMSQRPETHLLIARSFERLELISEALSEYALLSSMELSPSQRSAVESKIESLRSSLKK
ncbi:MAG: hypothetical protein ACP5JH_04260 [Bacteroidota bacterium]